MQFIHDGLAPTIDPTARLAPNAVVCGDVTIGARSSVGYGVILNAESGPIRIGADCVIMDTAVIRGIRDAPVTVGDCVLIGPHAYLTGCTVGDNAFIATGASVFNKAVVGARAEVRINAVVHIRTTLPDDATVPIGWIAIGDPARILSPDRHEEISAIQGPLDFPKAVFGVERPPEGGCVMPEVMPRYTRRLASHRDDIEL